MPLRINDKDISRLRLASQQLTGTTIQTAQHMVAWFGAVQGQEYAQTKWGLGLRLPHLQEDDIEKELTAGRILRTHLLRPTWHFVAAADIRWLLKLTAPRVHQANAFMYRSVELDAPVFKKCNAIISKLLVGHKHLTRDEINDVFKRSRIKASGPRLSLIMMNAELEGLICSGPRKGNRFTYALLEERSFSKETYHKEEALSRLTERYFLSRAPATIQDFSTWSGLTISECKAGVGSCEHHLEKRAVENTDYYFLKTQPDKKFPASAFLLPIYDELIMGYKNRDAILKYRNSLDPQPPFQFDSTILLDGQIGGTWKRTINKKHIDLQYRFFGKATPGQLKAFNKCISRFGEFNGLKVHSSPL